MSEVSEKNLRSESVLDGVIINKGDEPHVIFLEPIDQETDVRTRNQLIISFPKYADSPEYLIRGSWGSLVLAKNSDTGLLAYHPNWGPLNTPDHEVVLHLAETSSNRGLRYFDLNAMRRELAIQRDATEKRENAPIEVYFHATRNHQEALEIVGSRKLRSCVSYKGKEDLVFAVNLTTTMADPRVQLWHRRDGVVFTTRYQRLEAEDSNQVYWNAPEEDEKGSYLPLDMVFPVDDEGLQLIREMLESDSPEWVD